MKLHIKVSERRWVLAVYTEILLLVCRLFKTEPDWVKVQDFIERYCVKVELVRGKPPQEAKGAKFKA